MRLAPAERRTVSFTLRRADLKPGRCQLWIACSAQSEGVAGTFDLAAPTGVNSTSPRG